MLVQTFSRALKPGKMGWRRVCGFMFGIWSNTWKHMYSLWMGDLSSYLILFCWRLIPMFGRQCHQGALPNSSGVHFRSFLKALWMSMVGVEIHKMSYDHKSHLHILTSSYLSNLRWCFILSRLAPLKSSFLFNLEEIVEQSSYFSTESKLSISVPNSEFFRGLSQFIMEPISRNCQMDIQDHPNKMCIIWALYSLRFNREQSRGVNNTTMIVNKLSL